MESRRDSGVVSYDVFGEGDSTVICVPSIGDLKEEYRYLVPKLRESGFRVITMDIQGMGGSPSDFTEFSAVAIGSDIIALIDTACGGKPAWVAGCSLSACSAVWAAVESPENVAGLVLISPAVRDEAIPLANRILYWVALRTPWGPGLWTGFYRSLYRKNEPHDFEVYLSKLKENLSERGRMRSVRIMTFASREECTKRLDKVRCPVIAIYGSEDPDFKEPGKEGEWVKKKTDAQVEIFEGVGHYPHIEVPDEVASKITSYIHSRDYPLSG